MVSATVVSATAISATAISATVILPVLYETGVIEILHHLRRATVVQPPLPFAPRGCLAVATRVGVSDLTICETASRHGRKKQKSRRSRKMGEMEKTGESFGGTIGLRNRYGRSGLTRDRTVITPIYGLNYLTGRPHVDQLFEPD